ncbi:PepSY-associated TM helix domain-containing protein [Acetobacter tropicalis]|uniref:PepSY domain-containing protein n=1 Tax=Acetobacter tropicalis TaxID=104102 RepID=A0A252ABU2_9PROT|nr:PepSY-associated TM helix domain-containing protein [Acetobacter tropicalis]OUI87056.1 hypothetical protein HC62_01200 [Acetobacter tropicalis]
MKIRGDIVRTYRDAHSWVGIIAGLFLFVAFYAGAITMFEQPLQEWASSATPRPAPTPLERMPSLMEKLFSAHPEAARNYSIALPAATPGQGEFSWSAAKPGAHGRGGPTTQVSLSETGELIMVQSHPSAVAHFVDELHQQVGLPLPHMVSRYLMGTVALLYAVALISGVIAFLPGLAKNLFAVRLGRNSKKMWLDMHNLLGVFSLPFHLIMALTSVVFAFHEPIFVTQHFLLGGNHASHHTQAGAGHGARGQHGGADPSGVHPGRPPAGSSDTAPAAQGGQPNLTQGNASPEPAQPLPLPPQQILAALARQASGFVPDSLNYTQRPGAGLVLSVAGHDPRYSMRGPVSGFAEVNPYTGRVTSTDYLPGHQSTGFSIITTFFALHFGSFGGVAVRWGYVVLGLGGAFLFYTGNRLWVASRQKQERKSGRVEDTRGTRFLACLTSGCALGCVAGISAVFCAVPFLPQGGTYSAVMQLYYAVFCVFVVAAFLLGSQRCDRVLLAGAGILTALVPVSVSLAGHGGWLSPVTQAIGLTSVLVGVFLLVCAFRKVRLPPQGRVSA